ncbi:unnamed protein product [Amoebophrya sp. A120]|nr:unnamed protein product [Amoebophrya sp. A120]|eukprot:GSA120T00013544001.1
MKMSRNKSLTMMKKMSVAPAPLTAAVCSVLVVLLHALCCGWSSFSCVTSVRAVLLLASPRSRGQPRGGSRGSSRGRRGHAGTGTGVVPGAEQGGKAASDQGAHWGDVPDPVWAVINEGARARSYPGWSDLISLFRIVFSGELQPGAAQLEHARDAVLLGTIQRAWGSETGLPITPVEEGLIRWHLFFQAWSTFPQQVVSPLAEVSRRFRGFSSVRQPARLGQFLSEELFATSHVGWQQSTGPGEYIAGQQFASKFLATFETALKRPGAATYLRDGTRPKYSDLPARGPQDFGWVRYGGDPLPEDRIDDPSGGPGTLTLRGPTPFTEVIVQPPPPSQQTPGDRVVLKIVAKNVPPENIQMPDLLLPAPGNWAPPFPVTQVELQLCTDEARSSSSSLCKLLQRNGSSARATVRVRLIVSQSTRDDVAVERYDLAFVVGG